MKSLSKQERQSRVLARGEHSNNSHIITGNATVTERNGEKFITVGEDQDAALKHLLETEWLNGKEIWTKEHTEISLKGMPEQVRQGDVLLQKVGEREYKFIQQKEYDPYEDVIRAVAD